MLIIVASFPSKQSKVDGSLEELRVFDVEVVNNFFTCIKEIILSDNVSSQNIVTPKLEIASVVPLPFPALP